jgi:uncharacterized protein YjbK
MTEADSRTQTNFYFDTDYSALSQNKMALRIRTIKGKASELTLKVPNHTGLTEITDELTPTESDIWLTLNEIPSYGEVRDYLMKEKFVVEDIHLIGKLKTKRFEKRIPEGLLALDESWYEGKHDFEMELEVDDAETGKADFKRLLSENNVEYRKSRNKVQRLFETIKNK